MPSTQTVSFRALQVYCVLSAAIAIVGGGNFVVNGVDGVPRAVATEYPGLVADLEVASAAIDAAVRPTFDTWYRSLGWYWLVTGLMLLWIVPRVRTATAWFRFIHLGFMATGVANAVTIATTGTNVHSRYDAVAIELTVPTVAILWQTWVAHGAAAETTPAGREPAGAGV